MPSIGGTNVGAQRTPQTAPVTTTSKFHLLPQSKSGYNLTTREQQRADSVAKPKTDPRTFGHRHMDIKAGGVGTTGAPIGQTAKPPVTPGSNELDKLFKKQASESKPLLSVKPKLPKKPEPAQPKPDFSHSSSAQSHAKEKSREKSSEKGEMSKEERRALKLRQKEKEARRLAKEKEEQRQREKVREEKQKAKQRKQQHKDSDESSSSATDSESDEETRAQKTLAKEFEEIMAGLEVEPVC
jgi:hypothetical protein